jgi:glycosyltransferase involved in cell wall biosynthesis
VERRRVSLCMIARNEEANLSACLQSAADLVDEIILVDTGSTDRTKEATLGSGARVFDFAWVDDFAAARNESIRHAGGDWIFWLDADDRIDETNRSKLRSLFAELRDENSGYLMKSVSCLAPPSNERVVLEHVRLFPNRPNIRWQYRVHESITPALSREGAELRLTDIVIQHGGYREKAAQEGKLQRNLRLLLMDNAEHPEEPSVLFHLGWTYQGLNRPAEALPILQRSLELSRALNQTMGAQYAAIVLCQRQLGRDEEALATCQEGRLLCPDDPDLLSHESALRWQRGDLRGAEESLVRLLEILPEMKCSIAAEMGHQGNTVRQNLAVIYSAQGRHADAEAQLRAILKTQPDSVDAWMGLADVWVAQGRLEELSDAAKELEADSQRFLPSAVLAARLRLAHGDFSSAELILTGTIARAPEAFYPRLMLCDVLCRQGTDLAAIEGALCELLARYPHYVPARQKLNSLLQQQGRST